MIKKIFLLTIALLCAVAQGAWAKSVTFRVRSWNSDNKEVETTTETHNATVLEGTPAMGTGTWGMRDKFKFYQKNLEV